MKRKGIETPPAALARVQFILALDPGLKTGWALLHLAPLERRDREDQIVESGVWKLGGSDSEARGERFAAFDDLLFDKLAELQHGFIGGPQGVPALLAYENVLQRQAPYAARMYGGILGLALVNARAAGFAVAGVSPGQAKKMAGFKGNAKKGLLVIAARTRWPEANLTDENEIDARFIALAAGDLIRRGENFSHFEAAPSCSRSDTPTQSFDSPRASV